MAVTIDWLTRVIHVPQDYLTPLGGDRYELDVNDFRLAVADLMDDAPGIVEPDVYRHNSTVALAGVTYARAVEIVNGYTVEFEDVGTPYSVAVVGGNHNIADVKVINQVSLITANSAGLIVVDSGSSYADFADAIAALTVRSEDLAAIIAALTTRVVA